MTTPHADAAAAGRFTSPGSEISVNRMGYGAMQLAGPGVFGPATDPDEARAVLHEALVLSVDHIDTSDFYDPLVTNDLIREALSPYPDKLTLATKIGAWRDDKSGWNHEHSADFLRRSVEDNLTRLDLSQMAIVNLRMFTPRDDIATLMQAMRQMQEEGLIGHIGVSTVDTARLQIARDIAPIVCVQNHCNLVRRGYDAMIDALNADGIAYVPYFPLGRLPAATDGCAQYGGNTAGRISPKRCAGLAAAAQPQYPGDTGHVVTRPSAQQYRCRQPATGRGGSRRAERAGLSGQ